MSRRAPDEPLLENDLQEAAEQVNTELAKYEKIEYGKETLKISETKARIAKPSLVAMQRSALMLALGVLLAAGVWSVIRKPIRPRQYSTPDIEAQLATVPLRLRELRQAWGQAPDAVKQDFAQKLTGQEDSRQKPRIPPQFEAALFSLLAPAWQLQKTPIPESEEKKGAFGRMLVLVNASLTAARVELSLMTALDERPDKELGIPELASLQELKAQTGDLVDHRTFLQLVAGEEGTKTTTATSGIPGVLAQGLARVLAVSKLRSEAKAELSAAFKPFLEDCDSWFGVGELQIPHHGKIPTAALVTFMQQFEGEGSSCLAFVDKILKALEKSFTVDTAFAAYQNTILFTAKQSTAHVKAFHKASKAGEALEAGKFYFSLLHLLK
ncbi:hypothetical protein ACSSS7_004425 [Eimeria intestinalis]